MRKSIASVLLTFMTVVWVGVAFTRPAKAQSETLVFVAVLSATNEVAPVAVAASEQGARGFATVTLNVTRSGGTITAATAAFDVSLTGLASNSVIILSHIHEGGATVNGPVRVDSGLSPSSPVPAPGAVTFSRTNLTATPAIAQAIISNPGGFYFNVHTALSPSGVARGQLSPQQVGSVPGGAPTLSEWGAILMTLLFIAVCTFFLLGRSKTALAMAGGEQTALTSRTFRAVDWKLLIRVALVVEVIVGMGLAALRADAVDISGALTSGLILAYTIHLFIGNSRGR
jgi:CHRD domain-containing protein